MRCRASCRASAFGPLCTAWPRIGASPVSVRNQAGAVLIEVEGAASSLDGFLSDLTAKPPPLARIENLQWNCAPPKGDGPFRIEASAGEGDEPIFVSPDVATCADCVAELFDPHDRRYGYPFLNCTKTCGPCASRSSPRAA